MKSKSAVVAISLVLLVTFVLSTAGCTDLTESINGLLPSSSSSSIDQEDLIERTSMIMYGDDLLGSGKWSKHNVGTVHASSGMLYLETRDGREVYATPDSIKYKDPGITTVSENGKVVATYHNDTLTITSNGATGTENGEEYKIKKNSSGTWNTYKVSNSSISSKDFSKKETNYRGNYSLKSFQATPTSLTLKWDDFDLDSYMTITADGYTVTISLPYKADGHGVARTQSISLNRGLFGNWTIHKLVEDSSQVYEEDEISG